MLRPGLLGLRLRDLFESGIKCLFASSHSRARAVSINERFWALGPAGLAGFGIGEHRAPDDYCVLLCLVDHVNVGLADRLCTVIHKAPNIPALEQWHPHKRITN
jgi:hypothetical protein